MIIVWALSWWYGAGWKARLFAIREKLAASYDYFSIDLLAKTMFSPFRQISAGRVSGPIGAQIRAFFDRLISRIIGSIVRTILIIVGVAWLSVQVVIGAVMLAVWPLLPFAPLIGFVMMLSGWVPVWL